MPSNITDSQDIVNYIPTKEETNSLTKRGVESKEALFAYNAQLSSSKCINFFHY